MLPLDTPPTFREWRDALLRWRAMDSKQPPDFKTDPKGFWAASRERQDAELDVLRAIVRAKRAVGRHD